MNKIYPLLLCLAVVLLSACSDIDESERLSYVKPADVARKVLIEDFTGQRCVNCPLANDEVHMLQEQYGADSVIAVAIHSGPLGFKGNSKNIGLATDEGDEYYNHWGVDSQPKGMVNRGGLADYTSWAGLVAQSRAVVANMSLSVEAKIEGDNINIAINTTGTGQAVSGKLQVWVTEDSITALQRMPDGTNNREYIHNHVYRKAVNGLWGDDFSTQEGKEQSLSYTQAIDAAWNREQLAVVAFVYTDAGVEQVEIAHVEQ